MVTVSPNIVRVWTKEKYKKVRKDIQIQLRNDNNQPIDDWDKLDYGVTLQEVDCINNTIKIIEWVEYNDEEKILERFDNPDTNRTTRILPESMGESLSRKICPK